VSSISIFLIVLIALEHLSFMVLEMFFWSKPLGRRVFKHTVFEAKKTETLAKNQGLYNGFLAAGLFWALLHPNQEVAIQISTFFLLCVIVARLYGAYSAHKKILFVQALPAFLAITTLFVF